MPQLFSPKFVDLVRVTTSTQGTGPLVCGPAVPGHATFIESITVGDSFYYSVQGVDKPQEREVGRGTLLSNGTITRQPLLGSPTNFTSGSKTIALVAASEWFASTNEAMAGAARNGSVGSRADLKSVSGSPGYFRHLGEAQREGTFLWDASVPIATHQADTLEGIYVAPNAVTSGAWVRKFDGPVNVRWFGAKGDSSLHVNATNDGPSFLAAIAYLKSRSQLIGYGKGSGDIFIPAGVYWLNTSTLNFDFATTFAGEGGSAGSAGGGTMLKFANGTTAIRTQSVNTTGATGFNAAWTDYTAGRIMIRDLVLHGGYFNGAESEAHGIHLRMTAAISNVGIYNFAGDGIYSRAAAGGGAGFEGNSNISFVENVFVQGCRNGLYLDSADANAWNIVGFNANSNRKWGVWDTSFLGNNYLGVHTAANGWDGAGVGGIPTACTYLGNRYMVKPEQEAWCSANAPSGTAATNQGWLYLDAGGTYTGVVPWVSGTVFRAGGAFFADDVNATNVLTGLYVEGDQNPAYCQDSPTLFVGGLPGGIDPRRADGTRYRGIVKGDATGVRLQAFSSMGDAIILGAAAVGPQPGIGVIGDGSLTVHSTNSRADYKLTVWNGSNVAINQGGLVGFNGAMRVEGAANGLSFRANNVDVAFIDGTATAIDLAAGKVLKVNGQQVIGARGTAIADVAMAVAAPTKAEFDALVGTVNTLLARLRASTGHGLIS